MDSDILVLGDMSALFGCGSFCAMFIDPCIFNSGIMVITPVTTMFNDLVQKMGHIDSYDGADQGYFNGILLYPPTHPYAYVHVKLFGRENVGKCLWLLLLL